MKKLFFTLLLSLCIVGPALAQETRDWSGDEIRGIHYAVPRNALLPDRWQTELQHTEDCQAPCVVEFDDRMSTVYLRYKWMQVNPEEGVYDFSNLGETLDVIAAAGKPVSLIVMAGKYTPPWLFKAGAGHLKMQYRKQGDFSQKRVPLVWERAYIDAHGEMIQALSAFLRETPERYATIALVKNGALTTHSGETRVMPPKAFLRERDTRDAAKVDTFRAGLCVDYAQAGYTEAGILQAAQETTAQIAAAFPDKYLGLAFVAGGQRFPTVNASGHCAYPKKNATLNGIIKDMVRLHGKRAIINSTVLTAENGSPPILKWVLANGGQIGFQVEAFAVGCRKSKNACDRDEFEEAIHTGINAGATFIEVHDGNINKYKDELRRINRQMTDR